MPFVMYWSILFHSDLCQIWQIAANILPAIPLSLLLLLLRNTTHFIIIIHYIPILPRPKQDV
jgi:hypothetical protein